MAISSAVDASAVARVVGIETKFSDLRAGNILFLPSRVAIVGQMASSVTAAETKVQVTTALEVANLFGFGSPVHLAAKQILPANGDGVGSIPVTVYPLDDAGSSFAAIGDITPTGTATAAATYRVRINNILSEAFAVSTGDSPTEVVDAMVIAINSTLDMPVIATDGVTLVITTSKWKGSTSNDIFMEIVGDTDSGITFAIQQGAGGSVDPDVDTALAQIGNVWETFILNCLEISDTATLDKYSVVNEGRWGALVRKPFVVFTGNTETVVATAVTVPDARKSDRTNCQLVSPGSNDLPFVVAARQLARIAVLANNNPPHDYGSQAATGLTPGADGDQWDYAARDVAVKAGSSTVEVKDSVVNVADVVTFYHPTGDTAPAYRYVVDIVKLMNIIFNIDLIFATAEWDGAPLIPDDQPTINPSAKQPKSAVAAMAAMLDSLGLNAFISDPDTAKANTFAEIDAGNPKRLNVATIVQLSGNTNIISADLNFGFFFGG